ncbi:hypothetical protein MKEN_00401000 [Mycena kentingensis (nom. inval.)]|nr:hypothetical protein MKEN_00401000 [Mycena kentingensis (nom. inval.)]
MAGVPDGTVRIAQRLHHDERTRLRQQTRKIEEITGAAPQLVGVRDSSYRQPPSAPRALPTRHRREPTLEYLEIPNAYASNSAASASARPVLFIRLPDPEPPTPKPIPAPPPSANTTSPDTLQTHPFLRAPPPSTPAPSPTAPSPTLTVLLSLDTLSSSSGGPDKRRSRHAVGGGAGGGAFRRYGVTVKDESARRRTMAKLSRTLGEHVPPALVFPPESDAKRRDERAARRLTVRSIKSDRGSVRSMMSFASTGAGTGAGTRKRKEKERKERDPISRGWVWVGRPEEIPAGVRVHRRKRVESGAPFNWYAEDDKPDIQEEDSVNANALEGDATDTDTELGLVSSPYAPYTNASLRVRRREEGWSGEWVGASGKVQNMDDVVNGLRSLKVK